MDINVLRFAQSKQRKNTYARENTSPELLRRFLQPDRLVPIDGRIAEEAGRIVKPGMSSLEKARAIYDYVVETMAYDKSGTGWGRGDALWACDAKRGNCTDFHSLFIGMARALGIPARFVMGFPVPEDKKEGEITGYHCWAEFYIEGEGWLPVDASEAWKHPEKKDFFFGNLDPNRVAFTIGRDIRLEAELQPLNYLIFPQVRIDGRQLSEIRPAVRFADGLN
jgi:transglutaminase-like putative cysteine protease